MGNVSDWLASTATTTEQTASVSSTGHDTGDKNKAVEDTLPKLPVPDLQHTMARYLETLQPILNERMYARTKSLVNEFGRENGTGEKLQAILHTRRELCDNWVSESVIVES